MKLALIAAFALVVAPAAFAKANRHCVGAYGSEISDAGTKKQCKKAGGKWTKMKASSMAKSSWSPAKPLGKGSGFARLLLDEVRRRPRRIAPEFATRPSDLRAAIRIRAMTRHGSGGRTRRSARHGCRTGIYELGLWPRPRGRRSVRYARHVRLY